uniref:Triple QxxK/R motif-containing protein n=1 Tax=Lates calcarifer TaxID=8187 RepID=A0A4W6CLD8_LATCA
MVFKMTDVFTFVFSNFFSLSGKQDYKKTKSALKATRLKAEAKKTSSGFRDAFLVIAAILFFVLCVYAFFYLNLSTEINLDVDVD